MMSISPAGTGSSSPYPHLHPHNPPPYVCCYSFGLGLARLIKGQAAVCQRYDWTLDSDGHTDRMSTQSSLEGAVLRGGPAVLLR